LETREEREEFRACLLEMREGMNTTPVRTMDGNTDDGDVSELDAIPELDLATIPELDLSNIPGMDSLSQYGKRTGTNGCTESGQGIQ
jgi:hypothetical protein